MDKEDIKLLKINIYEQIEQIEHCWDYDNYMSSPICELRDDINKMFEELDRGCNKAKD